MSRSPLLLPALLLGTGLLVSCDLLSTPGTLGNRTVRLGQQPSGSFNQPFSGSWRVTSSSEWLRVTPLAGSGAVNLKITADRAAGTPLKADQAQLSGVVKLAWEKVDASGNTQSGTSTWTVQADQFKLQGRLQDSIAALGSDVLGGAQLNTPAPAEAHGVIVKYRASSALSALSTTQAQQLGREAAARGQHTLQAAGLKVQDARPLKANLAVVRVADVPAALSALRADPTVEYAVPNAVLRAQGTVAQPLIPTDQYASLQWPYRLLGYPAVWRDMESGAYSRPVTVAVVDSGVRFDHPDLAGVFWNPGEGALDVMPKDIQTSDGTKDNGDGDGPDLDPTDPWVLNRTTGSHGTHVSGIIAARWGENTVTCTGCSPTGVVGAAYRANVKILPVRALDVRGDTDVAQIVTAVRYAAGLPVELEGVTYTSPHAAQVINLSLGGPISASEATPMCDALQEARNAGSLIVVAAGNGYGSVPYYPAACPAAVAVGSVTLSGGSAPRRAAYSNAYPAVQLAAPGGTDPYQEGFTFNGATLNGQPFPDVVFSTSWNYTKNEPNYEAQSGTSQAAPQVSALAAMLLSKGVTSDATSTLERLIATATDLGAPGRDDYSGYGMINPASALNAPKVSDLFGLRLQNERGMTFQPDLDGSGAFTAFLGNGTYSVIAGKDYNGNGVYGEVGEPSAQKQATLDQQTPVVNVGVLQP